MSNQQVIIFGEVLFDCFPDGNQILGGAPFNVAWHLQAFGLSPVFISRIGNDSSGEKIKNFMQNWGMNLQGLQQDLDHQTGLVNVQFQDNEPHYQIVENCAYDFIQASELPIFAQGSLLYHGTLALRNSDSVATLAKIKQDISPAIFLDVNLRSPYWNLKTIESLLTKATWLKLNETELDLLVPQENNTQKRVEYLFSHYALNSVIVTQGKAGASSFAANGLKQTITPAKTTTVIDTVGAGDAFCSVLILGIVRDWEMSKTLKRAQIFASEIVSIQGATTQDKSFYNGFLQEWD